MPPRYWGACYDPRDRLRGAHSNLETPEVSHFRRRYENGISKKEHLFLKFNRTRASQFYNRRSEKKKSIQRRRRIPRFSLDR